MNCQQVRQIWDDYRDNQLTDSPRYSFERHMRGCPHCAELWAFETQWLEKIGRDEQDIEPAAEQAPGPRFAIAVVERWQKEHPAPRSFRFAPWMAVAASLALFILTFVATTLIPAMPPVRQPVARAMPAADPVGTLVVQLTGHIDRGPTEVRDALRDTASLFTIDRLVDAIERTEPEKAKAQ